MNVLCERAMATITVVVMVVIMFFAIDFGLGIDAGLEVKKGVLTKGDETVVCAIKVLKCECII